MAESATAEATYFHTLNARPYFFPTETRDKRLQDIVSRLTELPPELRLKIFESAFRGNRVAVTAEWGCYCASKSTGPYRADHQWLLKSPPSQIKGEATRLFVQTAMWEIHCKQAMKTFTARMTTLGYLAEVRHIRLNVYELDITWKLVLSMFPRLQSATFSPWQKGWTIVVPETAESEDLSDENVISKVWRALDTVEAYNPVRQAYGDKSRPYKMYFVFPIRFHQPRDNAAPQRFNSQQPRWQLCVWRADLDKGTVERDWKEVHLVQEATLD
ncbi:hypothetical protein H2200_005121 [Cladophialophora chaetospira]|uniref:Uncharacterized protein n=1 Tax=Cladophialophora chaetospira TaxID=386627 RepID=A0AA38XBH1_9EURO|nr:hypothetical protein H2200_005121 [Cladophialophora chaetospira]